MCLTQKGKVLEIKGKDAIVLVNGDKKEVRLAGQARVGDEAQIFQNLAFK